MVLMKLETTILLLFLFFNHVYLTQKMCFRIHFWWHWCLPLSVMSRWSERPFKTEQGRGNPTATSLWRWEEACARTLNSDFTWNAVLWRNKSTSDWAAISCSNVFVTLSICHITVGQFWSTLLDSTNSDSTSLIPKRAFCLQLTHNTQSLNQLWCTVKLRSRKIT